MLSHQFSVNFPQFVPNFPRSLRPTFALSFPQSLTVSNVKTFRGLESPISVFKRNICVAYHTNTHRVTLLVLCRVYRYFYTT